MKRVIVDENGQKAVDIPPAPPQKTLAELQAQLDALAAQIAAQIAAMK
jgi:hypothetical protein